MEKRIHIPHVVDVPRPEDVVDADDVLVVEAEQDLDLPQRALAVRLVLERADFLDGDALAGHVIQRRAAGGEQVSWVTRSHPCTVAGRRHWVAGVQWRLFTAKTL